MIKKTALVLLAALLIACGGDEESADSGASYEDGVYFAQADTFSEQTGWKYNVTLEVKDGEISMVSWNGAYVDAGMGKMELSEAGEYQMVAKGGASAEWHDQAKVVEAYLIETQDLKQPDAISGASIGLGDFYSLANEALSAGPSGYGKYKDGTYHAEQAAFDHGYKYFVDLTVVSGYVVAANWDALAEDGSKNKQQSSQDGEYGLVEKGGAQAPWWEQARVVEDYFLTSQDTAKPDAVSGATIGLEPFYPLVAQALEGAMR